MKRKTVLVTGATSGIGKAATIALANEGHRVIATGKGPEEAHHTQGRASGVNRKVPRCVFWEGGSF